MASSRITSRLGKGVGEDSVLFKDESVELIREGERTADGEGLFGGWK